MDQRIFISFSSKDRARATQICNGLERAGVRCWMSVRDVGGGKNYQAAIVEAIQTAKVMVLVFSASSNASTEVSKELSLASAFGIPVIPVRIENSQPSGALLYELATRQWIDAFDDLEAAIEELGIAVRAAIGSPERPSMETAAPHPIAPPPEAGRPDARASVKTDIPDDVREIARRTLASFLGPLATILVRNTARQAASIQDFHTRLAAHIDSADERAAFNKRLAEAIRSTMPGKKQ